MRYFHGQSARKFAVLAIIAMFLSACQTTAVYTSDVLKRSEERVRVLVMPMDVELSEVSLGGVTTVRADWTASHEWNELDPAAVTVPTLILQGEHDPLSPSEFQAWLFDGLGTSDKTWAVIPGGDHAAFLEAPRPYFLAVLRGFLSKDRVSQGSQ